MNNFKILSIFIVCLGLIATQAFAIDNIHSLDASEFFYGDSPVNNSAVIFNAGSGGATGSGVLKEAALPSASLSSAGFFYSEPISIRGEVVRGEDLPQRSAMAAPSTNLITPEVFYGYTDVIEVKEVPCANC